MGLRFKYATKEEVPEHLREFYVELGGAWVLSLEDAEDIPKLKGALDKEKNDHKAAAQKAAAEATAKAELAEKLKLYEELGDLESLQKLQDEWKKSQPAPKIEELQSQLQKVTAQLRGEQDWRKENEPRLNEYEGELNRLKLEDDRSKAKATIQETVGKINGVNKDALTDTLYYRYLAGDLKRSDAGEIVSGDGLPLGDFAQNYARERGFLLASVPGGARPPGGPGGDPSASLKAKYEEAKKSGDLDAMLELGAQLAPENNNQ